MAASAHGQQPVDGALAATNANGRQARVHNLKFLSDQIDDVTTAENILRSFLKPSMAQAERAEALWRAAVKYRHQTVPPNEFLAADWEAHDPVKLFNVYGYCMCCCSSAVIEALNRLDGRQARGRILNGHSVPEVRFDDDWHMYDASLITYFPGPDGRPASVDSISKSIGEWHAQHPGYQRQPARLLEIMRSDGWTGWKSQGPKLLASCPFYRLGYLPARTHGWDATMLEYDRQCEVYEYGYQVGHRAVVSLRPGESFVREAGNRGWHVNMRESPDWDGLRAKSTDGDMEYLRDFFPKFHGPMVGNGFHRYKPDLAVGGLAAGTETFENLATDASVADTAERPVVRLAVGGKPGVAVIPLSSPYVYLNGRLSLRPWRKATADSVAVSLSTNNGRTFQKIWSADETGWNRADVDLSPHIFRRYAYWLKIELKSDSPQGAGLADFAVENGIQHAPRSMPFLGRGENALTVAADGDPTIATRTVTCRLAAEPGFQENETSETMGLTFENLNLAHGGCWWQGGTGAMTVPVETPGEIVALRFGGHFRARGEKDLLVVRVSFDEGRTWQEAARVAGPTQGRTEYFRFDKVPPAAKRTLLRYEMTGNNTVGVLSFRVDADYRDPTGVGFRPFEVVHRWHEADREKEWRETVERLPHSYRITTAAEPEMLSVEYRMPPQSE
ncbi:MAG TPA: hypothetical protein VHC22_21545 [Pirellulales bacterium]|nr:hypothetical protein [Pirellulales bacterium]